MEVSPTKRRVLGSLDLNALSSKPPSSPKQTKPDHHKPPNALQSPIKQPTGLQPSTDPRKRPLATEGQKEQQQSAKRICAGDDKVQDKQENKVRPATKVWQATRQVQFYSFFALFLLFLKCCTLSSLFYLQLTCLCSLPACLKAVVLNRLLLCPSLTPLVSITPTRQQLPT